LEPLLSEVRGLKAAGGNYNPEKLFNQLVELNRMLRHIEEDINAPLFSKIFSKKRKSKRAPVTRYEKE